MIGTQKVGILGGMGPAAGAEFVKLFVEACRAELQTRNTQVCDQVYPEHFLIQSPIPDRTAALERGGACTDIPLIAMHSAMDKLAGMGVTSVAIACSTAHAWHGQLQEQFPGIRLLHVAKEVTSVLQSHKIESVGLLATNGTYLSGVYEATLADAGIKCHLPTMDERKELMRGIYDGVKGGNFVLAQRCFRAVAKAVFSRNATRALILGCTEIPLALKEGSLGPGITLIDPALVLAKTLARNAYDV